MNLRLMLEEAAVQYGGKAAVVFVKKRLSYGDLDKASNRLANALLKRGVKKGDRVALLLPNRPEFAIALFAIVKIGAIAVPLDPQYNASELASIFGDCQPEMLFAENHVLMELGTELSRFKTIKHVIELDADGKGQYHDFDEVMENGSVAGIHNEVNSGDTALIMYTSSPSYRPTGVMLSHQCLLAETRISVDSFQQTDKDVVMLFALPMFHVMGLVSVLLGSIYKGGTVVIVPGTGLSLDSLMASIETEKGTMWIGVPYIFALAAEVAEREGISRDLSSLRLCASAGAPLTVSTIEKFRQYYGLTVVDFWGLTEATCHVTCSPIDGSGRIGSAGKALHGWQIKIVDDSGIELPRYQSGEITINGPFMQGYYSNPQLTSDTIKEGWLHTGDIGCIDNDGWLFITQRKKDTIIVKGQNVHPEDVEYVLTSHPKVAEVAVLGIPDELRGEIVGAFVVFKEGEVASEQELRQFCLDYLAAYRVPKQIMFMDCLPRNASGEVDEEGIRKHFAIPPVFQAVQVS